MSFYSELQYPTRGQLQIKKQIGDLWLCPALCVDTDGCTDFSFNEERKECSLHARKAGQEGAAIDKPHNDMISGRPEDCL